MSNASRVRENSSRSLNYICPVCYAPNRTEGWLGWHLRKYHPNYQIVASPAGAREGNKYEIDMARRGQYRCPHIGHYCPGPPGKKPQECLGKEECWRIEYQPWIAGCFKEEKRLDIASEGV